MSASIYDRKYLSIFIDRIIPDFFKEKYPLYKLFIKYFLEYLEQDYKTYDDIANHIKHFIDIDEIGKLSPTSQRRIDLIDTIYQQFLGVAGARAISSLIENEILYIKNQKYVNSRKGIVSNFLYFFLLILGGYFRITNITFENKIHDGTFRYDGSISYFNDQKGIIPFYYLIISEFNPSSYEDIAKALNPAGMKYLTLLQRQKVQYANTGEDLSTIYNKPNIYFGIYNSSSLIGIIKPFRIFASEVLDETSLMYTFVLQDKTKIYTSDNIETGSDSIFYDAVFNTGMFTGSFDEVKIISNPYVTGSIPATQLYYDASSVITGSGEEYLYSANINVLSGESSVDIVDNTNISILIRF